MEGSGAADFAKEINKHPCVCIEVLGMDHDSTLQKSVTDATDEKFRDKLKKCPGIIHA